MNRREFVKFLALIGAGTAALPEQVSAFETFYEANTPQVANGIISIDEVLIGGVATGSTPVSVQVFDGKKSVLNFGMNLFGGMFRWAAMPKQEIIMPENQLTWEINAPAHQYDGQISFIDQRGLRRSILLGNKSMVTMVHQAMYN